MKDPTSILRNAAGLVLVAMSIYGMGCAVEAGDVHADLDEENLGEAVQGAAGYPGTLNHLRYQVLHNHGVQHTTRALGAAALANQSGLLTSMPYMPAPDATGPMAGARVEYLEILIGCALPAGTSVRDPAHITGYLYLFGTSTPLYRVYAGEIGLAPDWRTRGLTTVEKQLVTACVLQRTNRFGEEVEIMLEGNHPAITRTEADKLLYPGIESRAWGNMFDSTIPLSTTNSELDATDAPFNAYICHETASCPTGVPGILRQCDAMDACGFIYLGNCTDHMKYCNYRWLHNLPAPQSCTQFNYNILASLKEADTVCQIPPGPDPNL
ncbi:hypothetical protein [Polyangium sp. y55x31]|uniref:hypothetical protein n=1 Tax=Polyangium sp. y55x31 TaxID=3042688 RepID=UPI002482AF48|nr:hypothetical protein [Polyangium sp. y55x31]MDI1478897.1 hypothetical protein [Polyangium sp. y55x31]